MTAITTAPDEETATADERSWQARAAEFVLSQGFIVIFLGWAIFLSIRTEQFLTTDNLLLLVRQASIFSIVGIGTTMVVLLGELDISFGSVVSLAGCVSAAWIVGGTNPLVGFLIAILIGVAVGAVNGVLVTKFRIASVVATLGTLGIAAGLASIYTSGSQHPRRPPRPHQRLLPARSRSASR